jgi:hypothetical protein
MPASPLGKVKMVAQVAAILILILGGTPAGLLGPGAGRLWIATLYGVSRRPIRAASDVNGTGRKRRRAARLGAGLPPAARDRRRQEGVSVLSLFQSA